MCKIQALYNACSSVFGFGGEETPHPSSDEILWLQHILGSLESCDVGIEVGTDDDVSGIPETSVQEMIKYTHIHECDYFSMGVFCLPAGTTIPLHDHPEMVVLSKVLYGSLSVKSYDWVRQPFCSDPTSKKSGVARLTLEDKVFDSSSPATVIFPMSGGNIHSVTALTTCTFIDVLNPPYSNQQGRPSTYYIEKPIPSLPGYVILEGISTDIPKDLLVTGEVYRGPKLEFDEDEDEDEDDEDEDEDEDDEDEDEDEDDEDEDDDSYVSE